MTAPTPSFSLRAHHLMCVTTYQGKGYSPDFVANMNRVWHALRSGQYPQVEVHAVADPLCQACPNLQDPSEPTSCQFQRSIEERDRRLLAAMGWTEGEIIDLAPVMEHILAHHAELLANVCVGCDWMAICGQQRFTWLEAEPPVPLPVLPT
jgi:hypothetical protein